MGHAEFLAKFIDHVNFALRRLAAIVCPPARFVKKNFRS